MGTAPAAGISRARAFVFLVLPRGDQRLREIRHNQSSRLKRHGGGRLRDHQWLFAMRMLTIGVIPIWR
jgi:hypothetical protein